MENHGKLHCHGNKSDLGANRRSPMRTEGYLWKDHAQFYGLGEGIKDLPKMYHFSDFGHIPK